MTGLRIAFVLLFVFNLACLGVLALPVLGEAPLFMGSMEPERMQNQLLPERLQVVGRHAEPPLEGAVAPVAVEAPRPAEPEASIPAAPPEPAASPVLAESASTPPATGCFAFSRLTAAQAQALVARARAAEGGLAIREEAPSPSSYWVNIPPLDGRAGAERRAAELRELGLEDFFIVNQAGDDRYAISLGLFKAESLAQRQLETLQRRGVKGGRVTARINPSSARVELTGSGELVERIAREAAAAIQGSEREACKGG